MPSLLPNFNDLGLPYITASVAQGKIFDLIKIGLSYVQIALLILIIISGLRWMFSFGDSEKTKAATRGIMHAIIGYIIVLFSYSIVAAVIGLAK